MEPEPNSITAFLLFLLIWLGLFLQLFSLRPGPLPLGGQLGGPLSERSRAISYSTMTPLPSCVSLPLPSAKIIKPHIEKYKSTYMHINFYQCHCSYRVPHSRQVERHFFSLYMEDPKGSILRSKYRWIKSLNLKRAVGDNTTHKTYLH